MKKLMIFLTVVFVLGCKQKEKQETTTEIVEVEKEVVQEENGWQVLFDGTSFDGWHVYPGKEVPDAWQLEDGAMILRTSSYRKDGTRFNMVTDKEYSNFQLSIEWMVTEGANSGIMWSVVEDEKYPEPYYTGPEIQVLDNINHPDAKNGTTHQAGALYDMVAPSKDVVKPIGEWNTYLITINHKTNEGIVVLNGIKIVEFPVNGEGWETMVANSKFETWEVFGKSKTGKIALQDHGEAISIGYRNIKIKEL
ncbi:3-keto-disaccharide hydrolase [Croceitalea rosinachiae]|uniref:DUF1080 domain-containing protein n=1 Tax=Croceitalea rosinachiae TaxID=3075596 RepID=A0ABU3A7A7_9FLAO|nr:DUF1080 domain-containing protein [Croceitalea sp. F388]MDT0606049.1 DUF1080 domain-containing protein [Croceitalea sp. F388]